MNFIGRFETLQQDFSTICQRLNLPNCQLEHKNKTKKVRSLKQRVLTALKKNKLRGSQHYRDYFDDETDAFVRQYYESDIKLFGYQQD